MRRSREPRRWRCAVTRSRSSLARGTARRAAPRRCSRRDEGSRSRSASRGSARSAAGSRSGYRRAASRRGVRAVSGAGHAVRGGGARRRGASARERPCAVRERRVCRGGVVLAGAAVIWLTGGAASRSPARAVPLPRAAAPCWERAMVVHSPGSTPIALAITAISDQRRARRLVCRGHWPPWRRLSSTQLRPLRSTTAIRLVRCSPERLERRWCRGAGRPELNSPHDG